VKILSIDIGGTHVKVLATGQREPRKATSGPLMTPQRMVAAVKKLTPDWSYKVISMGYPGPVVHGHPFADPRNLGKGWVGFNFRNAFRMPVRIVNDAAMQALGSYHGGRMLFLGLGTGLGCAMIVDGILEPMEVAHLPYKKGRTYEDYVGLRGLQRLGKKKWKKAVTDVVARLNTALESDYVVLGGGNAKLFDALPKGIELGSNENAFRGGYLLWKNAAKPQTRSRRRR